MSGDDRPTRAGTPPAPVLRALVVAWLLFVVGLQLVSAELPGPPIAGSVHRLVSIVERFR